MKRYDSIKDKERYSKQFDTIKQASLRHRSIAMDSNDSDLVSLRLAYAQKTKEPPEMNRVSPIIELPSRERVSFFLKLNKNSKFFSQTLLNLICIPFQIQVNSF